eukprot:5616664-Alexandrium_andersonii.AAC.1
MARCGHVASTPAPNGHAPHMGAAVLPTSRTTGAFANLRKKARAPPGAHDRRGRRRRRNRREE